MKLETKAVKLGKSDDAEDSDGVILPTVFLCFLKVYYFSNPKSAFLRCLEKQWRTS